MQVGRKPDFSEPVVLSADRGGITVEHLCHQIHRTLAADFSYGLVWGRSSKHYPQRCARCCWMPCIAATPHCKSLLLACADCALLLHYLV